jgi:uncharacterized protein (DUF427 family)
MGTVIRETNSGDVLAEAAAGDDVIPYEGNLYFTPGSVNGDVLKLTARTYTCPYKWTCHWVDYVGPDGASVTNVAWVYDDPKPGHEAIKGRYGFYAGSRGSTRQDG